MTVGAAPFRVAVVGGGPAGLMAAEVLARGGARVDLFDAMPSVGRKFLLAGKGGLNLTHGEPFDAFSARYGQRQAELLPMLRRFGPAEVVAWADSLGIRTFVGSSGRVFPVDLKAAPLLRAWLTRLRAAGVAFHMRHRWTGWRDTAETPPAGAAAASMRFATPSGAVDWQADAAVLALGGASWPQLGSDGAWLPWLESRGVGIAPLRPSNCGFDVARVTGAGQFEAGWTEFFRTRHAGHALKTVALSLRAEQGQGVQRRGEFVITETGIEGSLVYALSARVRDEIAAQGQAVVHIDLLPDRTAAAVWDEVVRPRGARSLATHLKSRLGIGGVKAALVHELLTPAAIADPPRLAAALKALPLVLAAPRPIAEAISTAGGVRFESLAEAALLKDLDGVACAGEMLDWEAPTGGYLLTACLASGVRAAEALLDRRAHTGRPAGA